MKTNYSANLQKTFLRLLPIAFLVSLLGLLLYFDITSYLSLSSLKEHQELLKNWIEHYHFFAWMVSLLIYTIAVAISLPGATILSLAAGFLYGVGFGSILVVIGATCGASILFFFVRIGVGEFFIQKADKTIDKLRDGFNKDAFSYLLMLRFLPIFPFFLVNIIPAILNMPFYKFFIATFIGIIPGSIVYVSLGNGISVFFEQGTEPNLNIFTDIKLIGPLLGLGVLVLIQLIYKKWKAAQVSKNIDNQSNKGK